MFSFFSLFDRYAATEASDYFEWTYFGIGFPLVLKTCFSRSHSRSGRMTLSSSCYETPEPEALKGESTLASGGEAGEQKFVLK